jgi:O-antigen ligase
VTPPRSAVWRRAIAALLLVAVVALPLLFVPGLEDGYALPKATLLRLLGLAGALAFLVYSLTGGALARRGNRWVDLPLACFAGLLILSSVASVDPVQSFVGEPFQYQGLVTTLLYIGSFHAARVALGSTRGFRAVLAAVVWTGAGVAVYGIAQWFGFDPFWSGPPDERIISSVGQPNDLAAYLDLVVVAALGLWASAGGRHRLALAAIVGLCLVALALTFSRGGYAGLVVAIVVMVVPRFRVPPRRWAAAIGLTAGVLLASAAALPATREIAQRVVDRVTASTDLGEGSIQMHLDLWRVGLLVARDHPWLGTGPETFPLVSGAYVDQSFPPGRARFLGRFRLESPHNELIGIAAESGLPALVAYVLILLGCAVACLRRVRDAGDESRSIALVVLATLAVRVVTTAFMTPEIATSELFWVMAGAGVAATSRPEPPSVVDNPD